MEVRASAKFNFNLKLDGEINGLCFNLFKKEFNLELKTEGLINVDADVKTAITYNTENETPKYDASNRIRLHTYIPVAPVILECKFYLDSSFIVEDNSLLKESIDYEEVFEDVDFQYIVTTTGVKENIIVNGKRDNYDFKIILIYY